MRKPRGRMTEVRSKCISLNSGLNASPFVSRWWMVLPIARLKNVKPMEPLEKTIRYVDSMVSMSVVRINKTKAYVTLYSSLLK